MPLAIHVDAGHSRNGNPRRGFVIVTDDGDVRDFIDEGLQGPSVLAGSSYGNVQRTTFTLEVTPSTYRDLYNQAYGPVERQMKRESRLRRSGLR
jgi:hypothetical protein